jgi:hypothetical protein
MDPLYLGHLSRVFLPTFYSLTNYQMPAFLFDYMKRQEHSPRYHSATSLALLKNEVRYYLDFPPLGMLLGIRRRDLTWFLAQNKV